MMNESATLSALHKNLADRKVRQLVVFTDENVEKHHSGYFSPLTSEYEIDKVVLPAGEKCKTLENVSLALRHLADRQYDRNVFVLNFGGGAVSDLGGFVASIYKRGVRYANCPTTLLSMIDASVGGKTAVNLDLRKNIVGTFHFPDFYLPIDFAFLHTLPDDELKSGMGELAKYAFISSMELFSNLENADRLATHKLKTEWIEHCIAFKQEIVQKDPFDRNIRHILNFGHTVGHAMETFAAKCGTQLKHGLAVAQGMYYECYLSTIFSEFPTDSWNRASAFLKKNFNFLKISDEHVKKLVCLMMNDKKNSGGKINFTLLGEIGNAVPDVMLNHEDVLDKILFINKTI